MFRHGPNSARTLNNSSTYYIYDGEKPIQEIGPAWASTIYGIRVDEPVIRFTSSAVYYFYQDHEGSVTHVANANGLVEQYRYDVFGTPTIRNGSGSPVNPPGISPIHNRFMFTGREWAPVNLGFYEYRARAYNPTLGRFMSEDPKDFDGGDYNLFRYCHNDPEDHTDPMGLATLDAILNLKELLGVSTTFARAAQSEQQGVAERGQFRVDAQPISVNKGGIGASGSSVTTTFNSTDSTQYSHYVLEQDISYGKRDTSGNVVWSSFQKDVPRPGDKPMLQTQIPHGVRAEDKAGKWSSESTRPGSAIVFRGKLPAAHFAPFGEKIKASAFGIGDDGSQVFRGSHTWSAFYQEDRFPSYHGIGGPFPADP